MRDVAKGIPTSKIVAIEYIAETSVPCHLKVAARTQSGIRDERRAALHLPVRRMTESGMRYLADVIAVPESNGNRSGNQDFSRSWVTF